MKWTKTKLRQRLRAKKANVRERSRSKLALLEIGEFTTMLEYKMKVLQNEMEEIRDRHALMLISNDTQVNHETEATASYSTDPVASDAVELDPVVVSDQVQNPVSADINKVQQVALNVRDEVTETQPQQQLVSTPSIKEESNGTPVKGRTSSSSSDGPMLPPRGVRIAVPKAGDTYKLRKNTREYQDEPWNDSEHWSGSMSTKASSRGPEETDGPSGLMRSSSLPSKPVKQDGTLKSTRRGNRWNDPYGANRTSEEITMMGGNVRNVRTGQWQWHYSDRAVNYFKILAVDAFLRYDRQRQPRWAYIEKKLKHWSNDHLNDLQREPEPNQITFASVIGGWRHYKALHEAGSLARLKLLLDRGAPTTVPNNWVSAMKVITATTSNHQAPAKTLSSPPSKNRQIVSSNEEDSSRPQRGHRYSPEATEFMNAIYRNATATAKNDRGAQVLFIENTLTRWSHTQFVNEPKPSLEQFWRRVQGDKKSVPDSERQKRQTGTKGGDVVINGNLGSEGVSTLELKPPPVPSTSRKDEEI